MEHFHYLIFDVLQVYRITYDNVINDLKFAILANPKTNAAYLYQQNL